MSREFEPKLIAVFREGYSWRRLIDDASAGVLVGVVALPLSIAFAIASGVKPEQGLFTAIVGGLLISLFGGSRVQIGGPTGAFIVIVYGVVAEHGYDGLATATLMAGALLVVMGVARLGAVIRFIPYPVTVGFTAGIAVIILVAQVSDLLGLGLRNPPADLVGKLAAYADASWAVDPTAVAVAAAALAIIGLWPRVTHRIPGSLVAIVVCTAAVAWFDLPVETIGSRFGAVPTTLPAPHLPATDWPTVRALFPAAFSIALLAGIESLLSAVVADGMTGRTHRPNMELVAQGIANLVTPLFHGIPATGAIARTATNVKNGGRTPVAGIVHALTLVLIMLSLGRLAALIPLPVLAAILVVVAYNMSEWRLFARLFRSPKSDVAVLLTTFGLTVLVDLTVALEVGMVLAAFLFMRRMAQVTEVGYITDSIADDEDATRETTQEGPLPDGIEVFRIDGPFFFGAAERFKSALRSIERPPQVLILRMKRVPVIDATGLRALDDVVAQAQARGTTVLLSAVQPAALEVLRRGGLAGRLGDDAFPRDLADALARAAALVNSSGRSSRA